MNNEHIVDKPLSLAKLKKVPVGEWVWIEFLKPSVLEGYSSAYFRKRAEDPEDASLLCRYSGVPFQFNYNEYNKTWVAYLYRPQTDE